MELEITISNWNRIQPKSELVRHPHWLKIKNEMPGSYSLSALSAEQKWVWVCLLCTASKKHSALFKIEDESFARWVGVTTEVLNDAIQKLETDSSLTVNRQSTDPRVDQSRKEKNRVEKKRNTLSSSASTQNDPPEALFQIWNSFSPPFHVCRQVSKKRKSLGLVRWKENPSAEYWQKTLERLARSDFATGGGERGWKADVDWFLKPDTHIRINEGRYDNQKPSGSASMTTEEIKGLWTK